MGQGQGSGTDLAICAPGFPKPSAWSVARAPHTLLRTGTSPRPPASALIKRTQSPVLRSLLSLHVVLHPPQSGPNRGSFPRPLGAPVGPQRHRVASLRTAPSRAAWRRLSLQPTRPPSRSQGFKQSRGPAWLASAPPSPPRKSLRVARQCLAHGCFGLLSALGTPRRLVKDADRYGPGPS